MANNWMQVIKVIVAAIGLPSCIQKKRKVFTKETVYHHSILPLQSARATHWYFHHFEFQYGDVALPTFVRSKDRIHTSI